MKLHSPVFERQLRRAVNAAVRGSRALKRERRRTKPGRRNINAGWVLRLAVGGLVGLAVVKLRLATEDNAVALAGITLYLLASLCFQVLSLGAKLNAAADLDTLALLPITPAQTFRWQFQKYFRETLLVWLNLGIAFGTLAFLNQFSAWQWAVALLIATLAWLQLLALAVFCAAHLPRWPFQFAGIGFVVAGIAIFITSGSIGPVVVKIVAASAPVLNLLPVAWPGSLFALLTPGHAWWLTLMLLPIAWVAASLKPSLKRMLDGYEYQESVFEPAPDLVPGDDPSQLVPGDNSSHPVPAEYTPHLGPTAIEEIVIGGKILEEPYCPHSGRLEETLWRWLTPREQALAEFIHPGGLSLWKPWKSIFRNLLVTAALAGIAGRTTMTVKYWVLGLGLFVVVCQVLAGLLNQGRAFAPVFNSGVNIPMYAGYGIGFKELARFFFKGAAVQLPFLFCALTLAGFITAWTLEQPQLAGIVMGFKLAGLFFAGRFIFLAFSFSSGTNDTSRFRWQTFLTVIVVVLLILLCLLCGGASLFVPDVAAAWLLWVAALVFSGLFFWIYSLYYRFGRFDLMSLPRR